MLNVNVDLSTLTTIEGITQYILSNAIVSGVMLAGLSGVAYKIGRLIYMHLRKLITAYMIPVYVSTERLGLYDTIVENFTEDNKEKVKRHHVVSLDGRIAVDTTYLLKSHGKYFLLSVRTRELTTGSGGNGSVAYKTHITGLGMRSVEMSAILADMSKDRPAPNMNTFLFGNSGTYKDLARTNLDQLALTQENKDAIRGTIGSFWSQDIVARNVRLGIPNKRVIVLSGPPGGGKSSIARAIASEANLRGGRIFCASSISQMVSWINDGGAGIIIIDDIDAACDANTIAPRANKDVNATDIMADYKISLGVVLSALDFVMRIGTKSGDGCLLIITTNHPERIDPAVFRPGRVDLHLHIDYPNRDALIQYYSNINPHDNPERMVNYMVEHNIRVPTMNRHVATADTFDGALLSYLKDADATAYQLEDVVTETESMDTSQGVDVVPCY